MDAELDVVPSLIEALGAREVAACGRADRLREQIAGLSEELSQAEAELSRLRITRETVDEVLSHGPAAAADPVGDVEAAVAPLTDLAAVMLAAQASGDATVTSPTYHLILVAFAEAEGAVAVQGGVHRCGAGDTGQPRRGHAVEAEAAGRTPDPR